MPETIAQLAILVTILAMVVVLHIDGIKATEQALLHAIMKQQDIVVVVMVEQDLAYYKTMGAFVLAQKVALLLIIVLQKKFAINISILKELKV